MPLNTLCSSVSSAMTQAPEMGNVVAPASVAAIRWHEVAEYAASASYSAVCYEQVEQIGVFPVIVAEGELRQVERTIFLRDVMEVAHNAALDQYQKGSMLFV